MDCYGGRKATLGDAWCRATLVEAVLGAVFVDSGKSIMAVQNAMEWLGILQVGMDALERADIARERRRAFQTMPRIQPIPPREPRRPVLAQTQTPTIRTRVYIEISSDDEDNESVDQAERERPVKRRRIQEAAAEEEVGQSGRETDAADLQWDHDADFIRC